MSLICSPWVYPRFKVWGVKQCEGILLNSKEGIYMDIIFQVWETALTPSARSGAVPEPPYGFRKFLYAPNFAIYLIGETVIDLLIVYVDGVCRFWAVLTAPCYLLSVVVGNYFIYRTEMWIRTRGKLMLTIGIRIKRSSCRPILGELELKTSAANFDHPIIDEQWKPSKLVWLCAI